MGRTLFVGDVHACAQELSALLAQARFERGSDRLVLVGDIVVRGPDPVGTLDLARDLGALVVRGNHENKLLSARPGRAPAGRLGAEHERVARLLRDDDWRMLAAMPLWLDFPEHGTRVVHAGVVPGRSIETTPEEALFTIRTVDSRGRWSDKQNAGALWGESYAGPPHVVFGHNANPEVQLHAWATGIDTGCVYGGRLTGVVLEAGEKMPRGASVGAKLVSVPAARRYYGSDASPV